MSIRPYNCYSFFHYLLFIPCTKYLMYLGGKLSPKSNHCFMYICICMYLYRHLCIHNLVACSTYMYIYKILCIYLNVIWLPTLRGWLFWVRSATGFCVIPSWRCGDLKVSRCATLGATACSNRGHEPIMNIYCKKNIKTMNTQNSTILLPSA